METANHPETTVHFESFELDLRTHELYQNGSRLKIRGHPVDVLIILVEHPGELVTREVLQKRIWPDDTFVDFEQILNNSVRKLRDALGDDATTPHFIETLPRLGYRFIAPVEKSAMGNQATETLNHAEQDAAASDADPGVPKAVQSVVHHITKRWIVWPVLALAVAVAAFFGYRHIRTPLPAPHVTHYEQLTLDGREKIPVGTDGLRIYMDLRSPPGPGRSIAQIPISGGKITEIPIDGPLGGGFRSGLQGVSPDGSSLLVMNHWGKEGYMVWVVSIMGRPARFLTKAHTAAWSPDGRTVVYANAHGDIFKIPVGGGQPRLLHREDTPADQITRTRDIGCSPDGTKIRFTRPGARIYEISSTGANFHEWLSGWNASMPKCCGHWTPDGQFYLFLAGRTLAKGPRLPPLAQIWAADERQGRMRPRIDTPILLASGPLLWGEPIPSRDGKKIFARGVSLHGELERYDPTSKRLEPYLGGISAEMPDFSRDGKYVVYVSFPDGILWRANRDGTGLLQLTEPPFYPTNPRWSPDGKQILFTDSAQSGVATVYVISSQGGTPNRLLSDDGGPQGLADWSPDGTQVAYTAFLVPPLLWALGENEMRIAKLDTGEITERAKGVWAPLWSHDGRYIATQSNTTELHVFDLKTRKWNILPQNGEVGFHNWSHDSRFIYFECWAADKGGVYRVPVQGGKAEFVIDSPKGFRSTGYWGGWMSLDPTDAPLIFRDVGTDEIYALTLER